MRIIFEKRHSPSQLMALITPFIALGLTLVFGWIIFSFYSPHPFLVLKTYFIAPFLETQNGVTYISKDGISELLLKATPLILIAAGLSVAFKANIWNIGAEGQFLMGALAAGAVALAFYDMHGFWILPLILLAGALGGLVWGLIPALLKTRFNASEILTSLMFVYIAKFLLDYMVRGPLKDPEGYGFPQSKLFTQDTLMPVILDGTRLNIGFILAIIALIAIGILMYTSSLGLRLTIFGQAPKAARHTGFSPKFAIWFCLALSGGLAGFAGAIEVTGTVGQLIPSLSLGYGFTAIIVAFLGRLNPIGILFAGLILALTYLGGEKAQILLNMPAAATGVLQGILLFCILGCDIFIRYRPRFSLLRKEKS